MPSVTITLSDTPTGGVAIHTDYNPAVGNPCSRAQSAALEILSRTRRAYGLDNLVHGSGKVDFLPESASDRRFSPVIGAGK